MTNAIRTIPAAGLFEFMKARMQGATVEEAFLAAGEEIAPPQEPADETSVLKGMNPEQKALVADCIKSLLAVIDAQDEVIDGLRAELDAL